MEKKKAIAYREFVLEAEKAFQRIYLQEAGLTSAEIITIKERFSSEQFDKMYDSFETELRSNLLKYNDTNFIKAYLKNAFNDACRYVDSNSPIPELIIRRDVETEFLLLLWKTVNEAFELFNYYCEMTDSALFVPLYTYLNDLKKENLPKKSENENLNLNPQFDFDLLKIELENQLLSNDDKIRLVNNRLYDFLQWQKQYDVYDEVYVSWGSPDESKYKYTREYYPKFEKLCKLEIERLKSLAQLIGSNHVTPHKKLPVSGMKMALKRKTDVIKILSAMYDTGMFVDEEGKPLKNKQKMMDAFGEFLGDDFSAYSTLLSQAKDKGTDTFMKPLKDIEKAFLKYLNFEK